MTRQRGMGECTANSTEVGVKCLCGWGLNDRSTSRLETLMNMGENRQQWR